MTHARFAPEHISSAGFLELPALPAVSPITYPHLFAARVQETLTDPELDTRLESKPEDGKRLIEEAIAVVARSYPATQVTRSGNARDIDHQMRTEHHRALLAIYQQHMRLPHHGLSFNQLHPLSCELQRILEKPWEQDMLARARGRHSLTATDLPADPPKFVEWYRFAAFQHPLVEHELYSFLARDATREQIEMFLRMESAGEAAFDDLVALGQVGTRGEVKMEMASNYWDEMGNGRSHAVHTHLFHQLVRDLGIIAPAAEELEWQVLAGVNVMLWCAINRRNAFRAQGSFGAVELLAPQRCTRLVHGALRVGITKKTMVYYAAHASIDIRHAEGWLEHVIKAQVAEVPESRIGIAEGLLVRADASLDYFDYSLRAINDER